MEGQIKSAAQSATVKEVLDRIESNIEMNRKEIEDLLNAFANVSTRLHLSDEYKQIVDSLAYEAPTMVDTLYEKAKFNQRLAELLTLIARNFLGMIIEPAHAIKTQSANGRS